MHFTIPYVTEENDADGKKIQMYKIYINGAHHCSARYSKFYELNEDMKALFEHQELPYFPPKKLFKLSSSQIESRRDDLQHYLQRIGSSIKLNNEIFHEFLKRCQKETKSLKPESVRLPIYFLDGQKFEIDINSTDITKSVLEEIASFINITRKNIKFFGLFFVRYTDDENEMAVIRQIQDFEYPYLSLKELSQTHNCKIVLRKRVWDIDIETDLLAASNSTTNSCSEIAALEVIFAQIVGEVKYGWLKCEKNDPRATRLSSLIETRAMKETIHLARSLPFYGHMMIHGICTVNRPISDSKVFITIGANGIHFLPVNQNEEQEHLHYSLTRIKSWRISTGEIDYMKSDERTESDNWVEEKNNTKSDFYFTEVALMSFQYLNQETKKLETIEIRHQCADQIILMSMCLKNMAEEYVRKKSGKEVIDDDSHKYESLRHKTESPAKLIIDEQRSMFYCSNIGDDDL